MTNLVEFLPRDAMLWPRVCLLLSVCLSVASRSIVETDEEIELIYGTGATFRLTYTVF